MIMLLANLNPGVAILFLVLFLILAPVAIFFLFKGIKRDRAKFLENKLCESVLKKADMDELMLRRFRQATVRTHFHLFYMEISDAKSMRQTFGETQYNSAVLTVCARLERLLSSAKICRYEYDGLMLLIDGDLSAAQLSEHAGLIIMECNKSIDIVAGLTIDFNVNIGIASYNEFNRSYEQMMQNLELALVVSKRKGVNRYTVHTSELNNKESEEYKYYQEIKEAIENNDFTLYYQPIVDLATSTPFGFETLLRWNHKTLGVLTPDRFLNVIEQSGDINWVGIWAYEELLIRQSEWSRRHPDRKLVFTMNLSPKQLVNEQLVDDMRRILRKYRVEPSSVCMEIVEFTYFEKLDAVKENLEKLRQCGFLIAIDNYGPELNTLALLDKIKVDIIKLEKSFVRKAQEDYLAGGIINMLIGYAAKNDVRIVAEGIENAEMVEFVKGLGISLGQGYYFGRPDSVESLENF